MDSATEDLYMQKLQEYVNDEDKIITVPASASILKVSIPNARDLLSKFAKDNKKNIAVTYIITGVLNDADQKAVWIVKDSDLQKTKNAFKTISAEVIYSIQKSKNVDFNVISLANKEELEKPRDKALWGFVVSKNCTKRVLKSKKLPSPPAPIIKGKSSFFVKASKSEEKTPVNKQENGKEKPVDNKKIENKSKQGGIANMFSKIPPKVIKEKEDKTDSEKLVGKENVNEKNGSSDFNMDVDTDEDLPVVKEKNKIVPKETPTKKKKDSIKNEESKAGNKRPRKEKSSDGPNKRRKRIIQRIDSDSDDMFEKDEDEETIIEKSDDEPEPITIKSILAPKNKKRTAVERTFEDEEGFIVTKTEYVLESASEEEVEVVKPEKIEQKPKPKLEKKSSTSENEVSPKKNVKGKKGKKEIANQASIMSFFKKK